MENTQTTTTHNASPASRVDQKDGQAAVSETDEPPIPRFQHSQSLQMSTSSCTDTSSIDASDGAHTIPVLRLQELLQTSSTEGLTKAAAETRLAEHGENAIGGDEGISIRAFPRFCFDLVPHLWFVSPTVVHPDRYVHSTP